MTKEHSLTWEDIKNWWPLLLAIIAITVSYGSIMIKQAVLEEKIDTIISSLQTHDVKEQRIVDDLNALHKDVISLQAIHPNNSH